MINKYKTWLSQKHKYKNIYPDGYLNVSSHRRALISEGEELSFEIFLQGCMRFCPGCRNHTESGMIISNLLAVKDLSRFILKNKIAYVNKPGEVIGADEFLEKMYLLYLEYQLMAQRQLTLYRSPFKKIPLSLFMHAWKIKYALLERLFSSLMQNDFSPNKKNGKGIPITGITICGGEPLYQAENLIKFLEELKNLHSFKIWVMTGFLYEDLIRYKSLHKFFCLTDYIIEGPFMINKINLAHPLRGSTNQRIIDVKKSINKDKVTLWSPRYRWTGLFKKYWKKFSNPKIVEKYNSFVNMEEVLFYLKKSGMLNRIDTVKEYEKQFGDIRNNFVTRILNQ